MATDQTVFSLDNNTDLLLLDDEDDLISSATIDQGHQFLNFSRKINGSASMKRPVDIQLGIACGKNVLFSRSLLDNRKLPFHRITQENNNNVRDYPLINSEVDIVPLQGKKLLPPLPPKMQDNNTNDKGINRKKSYENYRKQLSNNTITTMRKNQSKSNSSSSLDRLVADVLKHIESCPDQTAYSIDLDRLKPKLEAYTLAQ
jgi:hypothetical protein